MFILITIQNLEIRNWAAERWVLGINAWKHVNTLNNLFKAIQKKRNKSNRTGMVKKHLTECKDLAARQPTSKMM